MVKDAVSNSVSVWPTSREPLPGYHHCPAPSSLLPACCAIFHLLAHTPAGTAFQEKFPLCPPASPSQCSPPHNTGQRASIASSPSICLSPLSRPPSWHSPFLSEIDTSLPHSRCTTRLYKRSPLPSPGWWLDSEMLEGRRPYSKSLIHWPVLFSSAFKPALHAGYTTHNMGGPSVYQVFMGTLRLVPERADASFCFLEQKD